MASVSSLDQDMRRLRLDRYTPAAANEIREWIESTLGERLPPGDLMEALRDGVVLCKLVNLAAPPGVRYKASRMPFVQMENISQFLKACEMPPINLHSHDRFLTVDLYDNKDPAQVLQCLVAFSRRANIVNPTAFPTAIGGKSKGTALSPESTGPGQSPYTPRVVGYTKNSPKTETSPATTFSALNKSAYSASGRASPVKSNSLSRGGLATGGPVSSWSSRADEGKTAPAWNIHQYGYMGGASQGNQGVAFGARRQITSASPTVPTLAEKEKRLREKLEREKRDLDEKDQRLMEQQETDEARAQKDEERRWQEETRRLKEEEDLARAQEEASAKRAEQVVRDRETEERMAAGRTRQRTISNAKLNGQFLSAYQAGQKPRTQPPPPARRLEPQQSAEAQRIAELERQLAEMKQAAAERERQEQERQEQQQQQQEEEEEEQTPANEDPLSYYYTDSPPSNPALPSRGQANDDPLSYYTDLSPSKPAPPSRASANVQTAHEDDWSASESDYLKQTHQDHQSGQASERTPQKPPRTQSVESAPAPARPLPNPTSYSPNTTRTSRFLSSNPAPKSTPPTSYTPAEAAYSTTAEVDAENARREQSQRATRAGGWASKSLLEREMERERERQREWEEHQKASAAAPRDTSQGAGPGQSWDVHQYGYTGGDSQNRGGVGLGVGGPRRQIIGPRGPRQ